MSGPHEWMAYDQGYRAGKRREHAHRVSQTLIGLACFAAAVRAWEDSDDNDWGSDQRWTCPGDRWAAVRP